MTIRLLMILLMLMRVVYGVFNFNFLIGMDLSEILIIAIVAAVANADQIGNSSSNLCRLELHHSLLGIESCFCFSAIRHLFIESAPQKIRAK